MDFFSNFLLNENKHYLGTQSSDILQALSDLGEDSVGMGQRALLKATEGIVVQIRKILHGKWEESDRKYLEKLQKVGVALAKAADEKDEDIQTLIVSCTKELEKLLEELGTPVNSLGSEDSPKEMPDEIPEEEEYGDGYEMNAD